MGRTCKCSELSYGGQTDKVVMDRAHLAGELARARISPQGPARVLTESVRDMVGLACKAGQL